MSKSSFIQGIGGGIIVTSLIVLGAYSLTRHTTNREIKRLELVAETALAKYEVLDTEINDRLSQIKEREKELALALSPSVDALTPPGSENQAKTPLEGKGDLDSGEESQNKSAITSVNQAPEASSEQVTVTVSIQPGMTAMEICELLAEAKIIDDAKGFHDFIQEKNITTSIPIGDISFLRDSSYEEVFGMLKK